MRRIIGTRAVLVQWRLVLLAIMGALIVGVATGAVVRSLISSEQSAPPASPPQLGQAADPRISYPAVLSDLPAQPYRLAVEPGAAALWFPLLGVGGGKDDDTQDNRVYRYDIDTGALEWWPISPRPGSGFLSSLAFDGNGNVWVAWDYTVVRFDPTSETYREYPLPLEVEFPVASGSPGTWVAGLHIDSKDRVWLARHNDAALVTLEPESGLLTEFPTGSIAFTNTVEGPVQMVETAGGHLWVAGGISDSNPMQRLLVKFDPNAGQVAFSIPSRAGGIELGPSGELLVVDDTTGLQQLDATTGAQDQVFSASTMEGLTRLAVDSTRSLVWFSGPGYKRLGAYDLATGATGWYDLPTTMTTVYSRPVAPIGSEPRGPVEVITSVSDILVDASGTLWFGDTGNRRIGMIPPP